MTDGRHPHGGLFIGILVTVIGVIFLLDQMEIVHASYVFQVFWPVILIAVGVQAMVRTGDFRGSFWGPVLVLIGGLWLLNNLAFTHFPVARLWPLWMIAIGVWLLLNKDRNRDFRRFRRRDWKRYGPPQGDWWVNRGAPTQQWWANQPGANPQPPPNAPGPPPAPPSGGPGSASSAHFAGSPAGCPGVTDSIDDTFERSVIFMSFNRRITSRHFRFGKISAVFGGFHLDFTAAEMEGSQAVVQIEAVFGGGEIRIPPTWRVSVTAHEIAGAIVDETYSRPDAAAPAKVLVIHGTTVFGGVVIKN